MILPFLSIYWGQAFAQKLALSCHTRNRSIFFRYCIDGLYLATFLGFKLSTNRAVIERDAPSRISIRITHYHKKATLGLFYVTVSHLIYKNVFYPEPFSCSLYNGIIRPSPDS